MSGREYLIDASAYWRIDRGALLTDDGDYAHQISAVRPELRVRMGGDGPD